MPAVGQYDGRSGDSRNVDDGGGQRLHGWPPAHLIYSTAPCSAVVGGDATAPVVDPHRADGNGGGFPVRRQFPDGGCHGTVQDASRLQGVDAVEKEGVHGSVEGMERKPNLDLNVIMGLSQISDESCKRKYCKIAEQPAGSEYTYANFSCSALPRRRMKISRPVKFGGFGIADAMGSMFTGFGAASGDAVVNLHMPSRNESRSEAMENSFGKCIVSPCQSRTGSTGNLMAGSSHGYSYEVTQQTADVPLSQQSKRPEETGFRMLDLNMIPERSNMSDGEEVCPSSGAGKKQRVRGESTAVSVDVDNPMRDVTVNEEHGDNFMTEVAESSTLRNNSNGQNVDVISMGKWLLIDLLTMNENTGEVPTYIKEVVVVDD